MNIRKKLQTLCNLPKEQNLNELYKSFKEHFPKEFGISNLLLDYIYTEDDTESSAILDSCLDKLLKREA